MNCNYEISWIGLCGVETSGKAMCQKHDSRLCVACGEPSTHDCEQTIGPFVCGSDLCGLCYHGDPTRLDHRHPEWEY